MGQHGRSPFFFSRQQPSHKKSLGYLIARKLDILLVGLGALAILDLLAAFVSIAFFFHGFLSGFFQDGS